MSTSERAPLVAYADGAGGPHVSPRRVAALLGLASVDVLLGWTPEARPWLDDAPLVRGRTVMGGYGLGAAVGRGQLQYLPVRLSAMPRALADWLRPDVLVVSAVKRGGALAYKAGVGWAPAAARHARFIVAEVDDLAPDLGAPLIDGDVTMVIDARRAHEPAPFPSVDEIDLAVARNVVDVLPDGATLQVGPGSIAEAVLRTVDRPVGIWSGLVTDGVALLAARGLVDGIVTAGYTWGGEPIADLAQSRRLQLLPVEETHDLGRLAAIPRFVACNTALQVALDGSVNVERVRGRVIAGIGGHADFCAGAARSPGGLSIIALRSTRGDQSTIVRTVEVVSTPRCDVDLVVTEHGVADLRDIDDEERVRRVVAVAAPRHREELSAAGDADDRRQQP
jgi:acyl-CoA hydrolase